MKLIWHEDQDILNFHHFTPQVSWLWLRNFGNFLEILDFLWIFWTASSFSWKFPNSKTHFYFDKLQSFHSTEQFLCVVHTSVIPLTISSMLLSSLINFTSITFILLNFSLFIITFSFHCAAERNHTTGEWLSKLAIFF